ncbi:MAG: CoA-binding protein [Desulfobacteraceae bacterium]
MSDDEKLKDLEPIFHPRSIAIAGASEDRSKIGTKMFLNFIAAGFKGAIYPVNPRGGSIQGVKIYPNIKAIQGPVDYVIVAIPSTNVLDLIADCVAKGVKAVQIFSAGFSETGNEESRRLEQEMVDRAKSAGLRIIGPNCVGISCPAIGIPVPSTGGIGKPGSIAFLSQSGGHTETLADIGRAREIRFSKLISFGNASDLNELDFLTYLSRDPETQIIGIYIEEGKNGRVIFERIKGIAKLKPVVVWKGGETGVGGEIAASHTGALAGSDMIWGAAIHQAGAVKVESLDELADTLLAFQNISGVRGNRAAIISQLGGGAGGVAVSAADVCSQHGLGIPRLGKKTRDRLSAVIRGAGTILRNPFDLGLAGRLPNILGEVLDILDDESHVDFIMVNERIDFLRLFISLSEIHAMNDVLIDFSRRSKKPLLVVSTPASADVERVSAERRLSEAQIAVYPSFHRAAGAIAKVLRSRPVLEVSQPQTN